MAPNNEKLVPKKWISAIKFAEFMGVSDTTIYTAIQQGHIKTSRNAQGKIIIDLFSQRGAFLAHHADAKAKLEENQRKLAEKKRLKEKEKQDKEDLIAEINSLPFDFDEETEASAVQDGIATVGENMQKAKLRKENAQARKAELDAQEKEGLLANWDMMAKMFRDIAIKTRSAILTIPDRLAPVMAGERDAFKCHRLLTDELTYALRNLGHDLRETLSKIESDEGADVPADADAADDKTDGTEKA